MATPIQYQDPTMQLLSSLLGSKTTTNSTVDPAAVTALQQLLAQMQGTTTPEGMAQYLGALFQAGAEKVPELTQAYANAAGARTTGNSTLQLALGDLNKQLATQAGQLALQQQQNMANTANSLAGSTRQQVQTTKSGLNPLVTIGGGLLLNQANKRGWIDKIGDKVGDAVGGVFGDTAAADTSTAELPNAFSIGNAFTSGDTGSLINDVGYNFDLPDFSGLADSFSSAVPSFDAGSLFDRGGEFDMFFADGGMPARNRTDMGAQAPRTLQGALQVSDAQMLAKLIGDMQQQQQQQQQAATAGPVQADQRKQTQERGTDNSDIGFNSDYSPDALGYAQSALKANSFANMLGAGVPGLGPVSSMVNAGSPQEMLGGMASGVVAMANPVAGLLLRLALSQATGGGAVGQGEEGSLANPENDAVTSVPVRGGRDRDYGGMDRGPGGSSGDTSASEAGAGPSGPGFANGGIPGGRISGPGTGTSDSIKMPMANLSNGEYIVSADVVNAVGPEFFDSLQAMFHTGGKPA